MAVMISAQTLFLGVAQAAPLDVAFNGSSVVNVPEGETRAQEEAVRQEGASHIVKTGDDTVVNGAKLRLDYPGTLKVDGVRYAGRSYSGTLTAENCPFILGPGALEVKAKSTVLILR